MVEQVTFNHLIWVRFLVNPLLKYNWRWRTMKDFMDNFEYLSNKLLYLEKDDEVTLTTQEILAIILKIEKLETELRKLQKQK